MGRVKDSTVKCTECGSVEDAENTDECLRCRKKQLCINCWDVWCHICEPWRNER